MILVTSKFQQLSNHVLTCVDFVLFKIFNISMSKRIITNLRKKSQRKHHKNTARFIFPLKLKIRETLLLPGDHHFISPLITSSLSNQKVMRIAKLLTSLYTIYFNLTLESLHSLTKECHSLKRELLLWFYVKILFSFPQEST